MCTAKTTDVAKMVQRGVDRCDAAILRVRRGKASRPADMARQCERIADLFDRKARWWAALVERSVREDGIPWAYVKAAIAAQSSAEQFASAYRTYSRRWQRMAAQALEAKAVAA